MKFKDLIKKLEKFDLDMNVLVEFGDVSLLPNLEKSKPQTNPTSPVGNRKQYNTLMNGKLQDVKPFKDITQAMVDKRQNFDNFCENFSKYYRSSTTAIAEYIQNVEKSLGSYDLVAGKVTEYSFSIQDDGTYDVSFEVSQGNIKKDYRNISSVMQEAINEIDELRGKEGGLTGIPSGFSKLDRVTSGFQKSDLIIIAARPGMGKTAFVLSVARNACLSNTETPRAVAIFSLEMSSKQLANRMISAEAEIESDKLKKGILADHEWQQLNSKIAKLSEAPIFIDDTPAISVFELRAKCRRLKQQNNIQMIIIDYLQLMRGDDSNNKNGNREQEVSYISRSLKALAKELNIPVIALSQLSRLVESRSDKKPMLSDLRESGQIEQDADMVIFCYRPEYYGIETYEVGAETFQCHGLMMLLIAKHRNGGLGEIPLKFIHEQAKIADYNSSENNYNVIQSNTENNYKQNEDNSNNNTTFVTQRSVSNIEINKDFLNQTNKDDLPF
jgi:replicative DNA helicase